jgi:hypothetical protein
MFYEYSVKPVSTHGGEMANVALTFYTGNLQEG